MVLKVIATIITLLILLIVVSSLTGKVQEKYDNLSVLGYLIIVAGYIVNLFAIWI